MIRAPLDRRELLTLLGSCAPAAFWGGASVLLPATAQAQSTPARGGTLVAALTDNPPHFITGITTNILTITVGGQVFDTLIKVDSSFKLVPSLAKSWDIAPDGLAYTFHLEPDAMWHDGKPFTSEDVKFSFAEINGKYNSLAIQAYKDVASIGTPDPHTVVFRLKASDPSFFPWAFSQPNFAQVYPKHIYEGSDPRTNPANLKPVGTGPFMFKEWVRGSHIILERYPKYFHADKIYLDRVVFKIIPEPGARQLALETGDIDHIPYYGLPSSSLEALAAGANTRVIDSMRPALGEIIVFFNLRNPPLSNKLVRKAIAHAVDRDLLVKLAINGRGKPAVGPIRSDNAPFFNPDVPKYAFDPARARQLLDEAGFKQQGSAPRFSVRLGYEASGEGGALQAAADIMREQLRAVGIDLKLMPADAASWTDTTSKWNFDMALGSFGTGPDPKIAVSRLYLSSNIKNTLGSNVMGYANPEVDDLLGKADREMNPEQRAKLYQQAQMVIVDDLPGLWLWEKTYPIANRKGVVGLPSGSMHSEVFEGVGWIK
jgi:peptide/nickel transport system substrate-binding protein